jgi:hypothetical protein
MRESNRSQNVGLTRRHALKAVAVGVGAAMNFPALSEAAWAQAVAVRQQAASESAAGLRFFTPAEHRTVDRLSDLIIPADDHSPGASAAKVADFIDYLLSGVNDEEQRVWRTGLKTLDRTTTSRWRHAFVDCPAEQQIAVLTEMAARENSPRSKLEHLFVQLKERTVQGYYSSEIGIHQELRYKGNTYLDEFVGCNHPEHGA